MLLKFDTEMEWLAAREKDITSTEIAALFGLHPYKSRLELWCQKKGIINDDFEESNFTKWGRRLQIPVAMGICEDEGWIGHDLSGYYSTFPDRRLGASYDVKADCAERGPGLLEVKIAESFSEDHGWFPDKAPIHYEFQIQAQLHCLKIDDSSIKWGAIGTLGRRQSTRLYFREYDAELGAMIDQEAESFWESIKLDRSPAPDYLVDGDILEKLRKPIRSGDTINLTGNNRAHELVESYREKHAARDQFLEQISPLNTDIKAIKNELHELIGRNERAIIGDFQISARVQHVEEFINHGSSYRRFDLSKRKK